VDDCIECPEVPGAFGRGCRIRIATESRRSRRKDVLFVFRVGAMEVGEGWKKNQESRRERERWWKCAVRVSIVVLAFAGTLKGATGNALTCTLLHTPPDMLEPRKGLCSGTPPRHSVTQGPQATIALYQWSIGRFISLSPTLPRGCSCQLQSCESSTRVKD
jgi:hypothetical protein